MAQPTKLEEMGREVALLRAGITRLMLCLARNGIVDAETASEMFEDVTASFPTKDRDGALHALDAALAANDQLEPLPGLPRGR